MNIGFQRQFFKGSVLSVDYVRNVSLDIPLTVDVNHVENARLLNKTAAQNAIAATTASFWVRGRLQRSRH